MKRLNLTKLITITSLLLLLACDRYEIYEKPSYLTGKLYTQLSSIENIETFKYCVELTGVDSIIDVSGYYTLMAPTDSAFDIYLAKKGYASVDDMPISELENLVNYHILQGGFTPEQLVTLSSTGWIDPTNTSGNADAFKRETLLQPENKLYSIRKATSAEYDDQIVLPTSEFANAEYSIYSAIRKYTPFFHESYFNLGDFTSEDFNFYFDRTFESGYIYYADAKVLGSSMTGADTPAENGFIYSIDRVVEPLMSVEELFLSGYKGYSFDNMLNRIYAKSIVEINEEATKSQVGYEDGRAVNLYDVDYEYSSGLMFDIASESTRESYIGKSYERPRISSTHNGMIALDDAQYTTVLDGLLQGGDYYSAISEAEYFIYEELLNAYMFREPIVYSKLKEGYYTSNNDYLKFDDSQIDFTYYSSNATVVGLKEPFVPNVFTSVTGALYMKPANSLMRRVVDYTGFDQMLKNPLTNYTFFPLYNSPNDDLATSDSSIIVETGTTTTFKYYSQNEDKLISINGDLPTLILNHISEESIENKSDVEFLKTLAGHYIRIDHTNSTVGGADRSTYTYQGTDKIDIPLPEAEVFTNGEVYPVSTWFELPSSTLAGTISGIGPDFMDYLKLTGIVDDYGMLTINALENYTVFVPSQAALSALDTVGMSMDELKSILLNHFIADEILFTDNDFTGGDYTTLSGQRVNLTPSRDAIIIKQIDGTDITTISEDFTTSNLMSKRDLEFNESSIGDDATNGVVHACNTVLILNN